MAEYRLLNFMTVEFLKLFYFILLGYRYTSLNVAVETIFFFFIATTKIQILIRKKNDSDIAVDKDIMCSSLFSEIFGLKKKKKVTQIYHTTCDVGNPGIFNVDPIL